MTQNYPFNKNGHWHTAIDIPDHTVKPFLQGRVVAYRIDTKYLYPDPFQLSINTNKMQFIPDQLRNEFEPANLPYFYRLPQSGASSQSIWHDILSSLTLRVSSSMLILEHEIDYGESKDEVKKLVFYSLYANIDPDKVLHKYRNFTSLSREPFTEDLPWYIDTEFKLSTIPSVEGCSGVLMNALTKVETSVFLPSGISVTIKLDNGKPITHQVLECIPPSIYSCKGKEETHILKIPSSFLTPVESSTKLHPKVRKDAKLCLTRADSLVEVGYVNADVSRRTTEIGSSRYSQPMSIDTLHYLVSGLSEPSKLRTELLQAYGYVDSRYLEGYDTRKNGVFTIKTINANIVQDKIPAIVRYKSTPQAQGAKFFDFLSISDDDYLDADSFFIETRDRFSGIQNARKLSRIYSETSTEPSTVWERQKDHKNLFVTVMQLQVGDKVSVLSRQENKQGLPQTVQFKVMSDVPSPLRDVQETVTFVLVRYSIAGIDSFYVPASHLSLGTVSTTLKSSTALPVLNKKTEQGLLFYSSEGSDQPVDFWPRKQATIMKMDSYRSFLVSGKQTNFRVLVEVEAELSKKIRGYIPISNRTQLSMKCMPKKFGEGKTSHTIIVDGNLQYPPTGASVYLGDDDLLGIASTTEGIKHQHIEFFMKKDQPFFSNPGRSLRYQVIPSESNTFYIQTQKIETHYTFEVGTVLGILKHGFNPADIQLEVVGVPGTLAPAEGKKDEDYIIETVDKDENRILSFTDSQTNIPVIFTFNGKEYQESIPKASFKPEDIYLRDDTERQYLVEIKDNTTLYLPVERTDNPETILYAHHSMKCTMENVHGAYKITILGVNMALQSGGIGSGNYWHRQGLQPKLDKVEVSKDVLSQYFDAHWQTLNPPRDTQSYRAFTIPLVVWILEDELKRMYVTASNTFKQVVNQQRTVKCYLENPTNKTFITQEPRNGKASLTNLSLYDKDENQYYQVTIDNKEYYVDTATRDDLQAHGTITTRYGFKMVRPTKTTIHSMMGSTNWSTLSNLSTDYKNTEKDHYLAAKDGNLPCFSSEPSLVIGVQTVGTVGKSLDILDTLLIPPRLVKSVDGTLYFQIDAKDTKYIQVKPSGDKDYFKFEDYFHLFGKDKIKTEPISIDEMFNTLSELYAGNDKPARPIESDTNFNRLEVYRNDNRDLLLKSAFEKSSDWCEAQSKRFNPSIDYHPQRIELFKKLCIWPENGTNTSLPKPIQSSDSLLFFHPPNFLKHLNKAELYGICYQYSDLKERLEKAVDRALVKISGFVKCEPRYYMQDGSTFCNWFLYDMCKEMFGEDLHAAVFYGRKNGVWTTLDKERRAWYYYDAFLENPFLEELHPDQWTRSAIQKEVDEKGTLIIAASTNTEDPGHVGFVAPTSMVIRTMKVGTTDGAAFEGQKVDPSLRANINSLPLIAQAGGRNGVMGFNYAFGGDYITAFEKAYYSGNTYTDKNDKKEKTVWMRFYRVRRN